MIAWEFVRAEMVLEMARWLAATQARRGANHPAFGLQRLHLLRSPVWGLFCCSGCGVSRAGFDSVLESFHDGDRVECVQAGLPFAIARARQNSRLTPLGLRVPESLPLTELERRLCVARLTAEFEAGQFGDLIVDLSEVN